VRLPLCQARPTCLREATTTLATAHPRRHGARDQDPRRPLRTTSIREAALQADRPADVELWLPTDARNGLDLLHRAQRPAPRLLQVERQRRHLRHHGGLRGHGRFPEWLPRARTTATP
jgi:hypothetical protein